MRLQDALRDALRDAGRVLRARAVTSTQRLSCEEISTRDRSMSEDETIRETTSLGTSTRVEHPSQTWHLEEKFRLEAASAESASMVSRYETCRAPLVTAQPSERRALCTIDALTGAVNAAVPT
ncbi:uncharacterized protein SPPG_09385 [Spizellomyces punctatus DAOM BR117]|uniref:Uncharacterized protein n=1 Tax=Spizellomyces punctatus (strain DAOM BR117) TaxID=645134 RepID=A0A0L0HBI6_SPIPD|nr:uncharacterized protein SPPG_09385 [Spizellomyces punctatus DAOM BR117]KNC98068.1 hypothetical protein SPPG_09385 [Spizellomyces punctatus DAOM BR117]|eukprot:XP_016606108.1 hypothetical protein SPPG_09385 [Spizellomyces punctatus DAOM BR117]